MRGKYFFKNVEMVKNVQCVALNKVQSRPWINIHKQHVVIVVVVIIIPKNIIN